MTQAQIFGKLLKSLRRERSISQLRLASQLGMDTAYLSRMETGAQTYTPRVETIDTIARLLELGSAERDSLFVAAGRLPPEISTALFATPEWFVIIRKKSGK